jgi:hypothetical protein
MLNYCRLDVLLTVLYTHLEDRLKVAQIMDMHLGVKTLINDYLKVPKDIAALAVMPVPKEALLSPVGLKLLACAQKHAYLDAFLAEIEEDANTIYTVVDASLLVQERLHTTLAVLIFWK